MTLSITSCRPGQPCSSPSPGLSSCRSQGEPIIETRGSVAISQCFYSFLLSVFLKLILILVHKYHQTSPETKQDVRLPLIQEKCCHSVTLLFRKLCWSYNFTSTGGNTQKSGAKKIWDSLICLIFIKFFERSNQIYWEDLSIWERARLALRANKYEMMKRSGKIELGLIDFIQQKEMKKSHSDKLTEIWPDITIKNYCLEISLLEFKLAKSVAGKFN